MTEKRDKKGKIISGSISRRDFIKFASSMAVAGSAFGFPAVLRGAQKNEVLLGHIHPMSGYMADGGIAVKRGLDLAVEEINSGGGIKALGGAKIRLLTGDHQGKPEIAISEAEKLIRAGAVALTGGMMSAAMFATTQVAEKYKIPHIIETATSDNITKRGFKYTFRICPDTSVAVGRGLRFITEVAKASGLQLKTLVHMHESSVFGTTTSTVLKKHAAGAGIEFIESIKYNLPATDLTSEIMKVKSLNPDILATSSFLQDGMLIVRTLKQLKVVPRMVTGIYNAAFSNPNFIPEMGKDSEFIMDIDEFPNFRQARTRTVAKKLHDKFGKELDFRAAYGYTAVYFLKDALERAKTADREAVREAMVSTNMPAPLIQDTPIKFDETGQNVNATVPMMQIQNASIKIIKPDEWAQSKARLPFPKWDKRA